MHPSMVRKLRNYIGRIFLCCSITAAAVANQTPNNLHSKIKRVEYLKIFSPPKTFLNYSGPSLPKDQIQQRVINAAITDGEASGESLELFKAVLDPKSKITHYIFYIQHHDDLFEVYSVRGDKILYKFYFSPN